MTDLAQQLRNQEVQPFKDRIQELQQERLRLQAEVKRMQPLIQATRLYIDSITSRDSLWRLVGPLINAADEYEVELKLASQYEVNDNGTTTTT